MSKRGSLNFGLAFSLLRNIRVCAMGWVSVTNTHPACGSLIDQGRKSQFSLYLCSTLDDEGRMLSEQTEDSLIGNFRAECLVEQNMDVGSVCR